MGYVQTSFATMSVAVGHKKSVGQGHRSSNLVAGVPYLDMP